MNAVLTESRPVLVNEPNVTEQYRRQAELMYLRSYVAWLDMQKKTVLTGAKKLA